MPALLFRIEGRERAPTAGSGRNEKKHRLAFPIARQTLSRHSDDRPK
jgi:hypothetical protein